MTVLGLAGLGFSVWSLVFKGIRAFFCGVAFALFGLKMCLEFVHFGLESVMVFKGNTGVYERICRFN